jgi:hypothetical protein
MLNKRTHALASNGMELHFTYKVDSKGLKYFNQINNQEICLYSSPIPASSHRAEYGNFNAAVSNGFKIFLNVHATKKSNWNSNRNFYWKLTQIPIGTGIPMGI